MNDIFEQHFGPQGPFPLREPLFHEVEAFYAEVKKSHAHRAIGQLIEKITGASEEKLGGLPLTVLRHGQMYLLEFINCAPKVETASQHVIHLEKMITSINGDEAWDRVTLSEPTFNQFNRYYDEAEKGNANAAMLGLIAELSGVNRLALQKMPYTKYREAEEYLRAFLDFFPVKTLGKTS
ncbi:phage tail assembly protein [Nissabacter sp. SGAir0207]|uniref:phage tail assembly protein n=1 Tax=Nissabacter sp. SGAir0207 TaxID=2126321 RepID=UPI0010CCD8FB|nr:phage tail assembly protein [Nissabacter sp. SGAir0207]QCR38944.1 hypothetical protein C1N62_22780 [Nissabacter sp. SGAir0207]